MVGRRQGRLASPYRVVLQRMAAGSLTNNWKSLANSNQAPLATALIIALLLLSSCRSSLEALPCARDQRCLRYGLSADIPVLDPHYAEAPEAGMIFRQLYDTLVYRSGDTHEFLPGLATDWDLSADGLVYTFVLRRDVVFHDGSRFDAAAVGSNIERIFDPNIPQSLARELLGPLTQYEVAGDFTIRLILASPFPGLLDALAQPTLGIASPAALETHGFLRYQFHHAGTGPFQLENYLPGERIELRRFEDYRVSPSIYQPLAGDEITRVEFVLQSAADVDALPALRDSLDVLDDLSPIDAQNLAGNSRVQILPVDIPGLSVQFLFNTGRPSIDKRTVRLALLLATNRIAISDQVYFNFSPVAWAPLSTATGYSHTGYVDQFAYNLSAAQALLAEAGYSDSDADGLVDRDGEPLALSVVVPPWGGLPAVVSLLQQQWQALGVALEIEQVPGRSRLRSLIQSGRYDLLPVDRYGIDPNALSSVFLADSLYGVSQSPNDELETLLLSAMHATDSQARRTLVYNIQAKIMDEQLILPIREYVRLTAARADLRNLRFDAYGFYPLLFNASLAGS